MSTPVNGKLTNWLLGALLTLMLFIGGIFASRLSAAEQAITDQRERIAVTETQFSEINRRLEEMGRKLDRALE